jgi:hypothetical protein
MIWTKITAAEFLILLDLNKDRWSAGLYLHMQIIVCRKLFFRLSHHIHILSTLRLQLHFFTPVFSLLIEFNKNCIFKESVAEPEPQETASF